MPPHFHHQAMAADLDIVGKGNRLERTQHRDLELEMRELGGADRRKSWIGAACGDGAAQDHAAERLVSVHMANAPAQFAMAVDRDERAAGVVEHARAARRRSVAAGYVGDNRVAGDLEQEVPVDFADHRGETLHHFGQLSTMVNALYQFSL